MGTVYQADADVVIVGGGTAGCVLAARLSQDPSRRVLLLEAGDVQLPPPAALLDATIIPGARGVSSWMFPGSIAAKREWSHVRGKVLGGSSTTNGGYFIPAAPDDVRGWEKASSGLWRPEHVRELVRTIENDVDMVSDPRHGHSGPMPVKRPAADDPLVQAFRASARAVGLRDDLDKGLDWADGFGLTPSNRMGATRVNTALAYLQPVLARPNLTIKGDAHVLRVMLRGSRVVGLVVDIDGEQMRIGADEVILAAGALRSPDLLAQSGVVLPGLGEGLHDDPQIVLEVTGWPSASREADTWMGGVVHSTLGDGSSVEVLQSLHSLARISGSAADDSAPTAVFVSVGGGASGRLQREPGGTHFLPRVEFDHLSSIDTRRRLREAMRFAFELVRAGGGVPQEVDSDVLARDTATDQWVQSRLGTAFHTTGGAAMGVVTDGLGRVNGVDGLRVADLSLLPSGLRRGPAASAVLVGEMIARLT